MKQTCRFMRTLTSNIQLYTAQMDQVPVVVFVAGELVGSGRIAEITQDSVKIRNDRYLRAVCEFKYVG